MMIAGTKHEAVVVCVFSTETPLNLLHLFLETARSIAEALEDTGYGRYFIVIPSLALVKVHISFVLASHWMSWHEELVHVNAKAELVVLVEWDCHVATDTQIGGNEFRVFAATI